MVRCGWATGDPAPWSVVSHRATAEAACRWYAKRCRIETVFSDQKSRGFHSHTAPLSDVQRLSRFFLAACGAYSWMVSLGSVGAKDRWRHSMHRSKRCDFSLCQWGLRLLESFFNEELPLPVQFHVTIEPKRSVWWRIRQIDVGWAADIRRQYHSGDFTQWKEHDAYQKAFVRLLRDLKVIERRP
jgi:hypothetical protein